MMSDARWRPGFDEVWDLTRAPEIDVTPSDLESLVESAHAHALEIGKNRCVFVVSRDGVTAILRLFERLTQDLPRTYHTVRTLDEAEAWLGLERGALAPE